ncbi:MAG: TonB-dependent receptor [Lewinellaceae bacterium]|nr:TonB-dependent receptor [Lewinellaceae bacterium]
MRKGLFALIWVIITPFLLTAQGSISGTIIDQDLGEPLIGASVFIEGSTIGASTDFDGKYQFSVPAGTYTLVVSYIGFTDKKVTGVVVKNNEVTYLDVALSGDAIEMESVVVEAKAIERSENAILLLQRKSDKIQDGISSQEMSRYAVGDAAAAMRKVTGANVQGGKFIYIRGLGDRYSLSQLNGLVIPSTDPYRNSAQLDLIPTNLLDNIITAKTFTPDQPGNFTGGNVDIKTKSFPEQFSLTIGTSVGYNAQNNLNDQFLTHSGGNTDWLGYDDGSRAIPTELLDPEVRTLLNANSALRARFGDLEKAQLLDRTIKGIDRQFTPVAMQSPLDHSVSLSFGNQFSVFNKPLGVIFAGNFSRSFSHLDRFQKANWVLEDINSPSLGNQGNFEDTQSTDNPTLNGLLGIAYKLNPYNTISANVLYNHNTEKFSRYVFGERPDNIVYPDLLQGRALSFIQREMTNYQVGGEHVIPGMNNLMIEWKGSYANSSMDEPMTRFFENQYNVERDQYLLPLSNIQRPFYFFRYLEDEQYTGKVDITIPFRNKSNKLKFGSMITKKDRNFNEQRFQVSDTQFAQPFAGDTDVFLADDNVGIVNIDDARKRYFIGNFLTDATDLQNTYFGNDDVFAAYMMLTQNLGTKLKFIGGVRYENTDLYVEGAAVSQPLEERTGSIQKSDFLPSANLVYSLNDVMNIRGGFSRTLARPNMREIAPFVSFDPLEKFFYDGNTQLRRTLIDNVDLRWEWYVNPGELVAVSTYYKKFYDPITQQYIKSSNPEVQYTNVDQANLYGVELELRKDLGTIVSWLRNFRFNTNLSVIKSSQDVNDVTGNEPTDRPFEGQPTYIVNAALNYANQAKGWDVILSVNSVGDRLNLIGREGTPDIYDRGRTQLDFNLTKKVGDLSLRFSAQNLLDDPYVLSSEFKSQEFVYSRFQRGITLTFGASYTIK